MQNLLFVLENSAPTLVVSIATFGLLVGSFLNVVIFRYPIMMFREWELMAIDVLENRGFKLTPPEVPVDKQPKEFSLVAPRSGCPSCGHKITALENLPVVSYLFLRGKCKGCGVSISPRYPLIELFTSLTLRPVPIILVTVGH